MGEIESKIKWDWLWSQEVFFLGGFDFCHGNKHFSRRPRPQIVLLSWNFQLGKSCEHQLNLSLNKKKKATKWK